MMNVPQFCKKHHLWPPLEWYKSSWFMGSYFFMLGILIFILATSLLTFAVGNDIKTFPKNDTSMEVIVGLTVGMFGILATFTVVFFAFRVEAMAINTASTEAILYIKKEFNHEEKIIASTDVDSKGNTEDGENENGISIYEGIDSQWWQLFIWGAVAILTFIAFAWSRPFWIALFGGPTLKIELSLQTLILLIIGMFGILVTFTVVLFAVRVAQLCQVNGRIASHGKIKELAMWHEELYHRLLRSYRKAQDNGDISSEQKFSHIKKRYKLLRSKNRELKRAEVENFNDQMRTNYSSSSLFAFWVALGAVLMLCFIGMDLHLQVGIVESLGGIISLSAILFALLIFFTSVFFLGRVVRSAIISASEKAETVSLSEFDRQKKNIERRIHALEKIAEDESLLNESVQKIKSELPKPLDYWDQEFLHSRGEEVEDLPPNLLPHSAEILEEKPVNILMHLRSLKAANIELGEQVNEDGKQNKDGKQVNENKQVNAQFLHICETIKSRWAQACKEFTDKSDTPESKLLSMLEQAREEPDWEKLEPVDHEYFQNSTEYHNARKSAQFAIEQLAWRVKIYLIFSRGLEVLSKIQEESDSNDADPSGKNSSKSEASLENRIKRRVNDLIKTLNDLGILQHVPSYDTLVEKGIIKKYPGDKHEVDKKYDPVVSEAFVGIVENILLERREIDKS